MREVIRKPENQGIRRGFDILITWYSDNLIS